jgi:lipoprotein-anchoring transpeptidase ErfK/SrfK
MTLLARKQTMSGPYLRYGLIVGFLAWSTVCANAENEPTPSKVMDHGFELPAVPRGAIPRKYLRQTVAYRSTYEPGTIVVDPAQRFMYLVEAQGHAVRYGISAGLAAYAWSGEATVGRKSVWPRWTPTKDMIGSEPKMQGYRQGIDGGPTNPLGARALYLYKDGRDTLYRLHGTSEYWSIGRSASSGCIRILNSDIIELFDRVPVGTKVVVLTAKPTLQWRTKPN